MAEILAGTGRGRVMQLDERVVGDVTVLAPSGRMTRDENFCAVNRRVEALVDAGQRKLVLDLGAVYMDSSGVTCAPPLPQSAVKPTKHANDGFLEGGGTTAGRTPLGRWSRRRMSRGVRPPDRQADGPRSRLPARPLRRDRQAPNIGGATMRTMVVATAGTLVLAGSVILGQQTRRQPSAEPIFVPGPAEVVGSVSITNEPTVQAQQAGMWEVTLADQVALVIPTPEFIVVGQTYRFTWSGSDAARTYQVLALAENGWVAAAPVVGGDRMWLNTSLATSIEPL